MANTSLLPNGAAIRLKADVGGVQTYIGGQLGATRTESADLIDVSDKDDDEEKVLPGRKHASVSLDATYIPSNAAQQAIRNAYKNKTPIDVEWWEDGAAVETAEAYVTEFSIEAPDQDRAVASINLQVFGGWQPV